jgi:dissimilatory sulfite reductase (desulfoviridin) alpha/beta subunit
MPRKRTDGGRAGGACRLDYDALKAGGIIAQRQKDRFTIRLKCPGGRMPLVRLARILNVARRYGVDWVHLSVRQSVEIPHVQLKDLERVKAELGKVGQEIASCGARVRVPTACGGCEYNRKGLTDTQRMVREATERFFGRAGIGHKFKMAFSGCPNDCPHTSSNDLGFQGAVEPEFDAAACTACGLCVQACKEKVIVQARDGAKPRWLRSRCLFCGDCIRCCPVDAWHAGRTGWMVRVGGKHGRHPITGAKIAAFLPDETVMPAIAAILEWYQKAGEGKGRRRIGDLLLEPGAWKRFLRAMAPVLGEYAAKAPHPPVRNEIH